MAAQYGKGPFVVAHNDKPVYRGPFLDPLTDGLLTAYMHGLSILAHYFYCNVSKISIGKRPITSMPVC
jgi:hypothetical protein